MLSITRIAKIAMRVTQWAAPKVQEWRRQRNLNRNEAQRHLEVHNWSEAEKHLALAIEEKYHSAAARLEMLVKLAEAQLAQSKLTEAEQTAGNAVRIAIQEKNEILHSLALEALAKVQLAQGRYAEAHKTGREVVHLESTRAKPDYARLASCSRSLSSALESCGQPEEAIEALKEASVHAGKAFGPEHANTASFLHELGMLHRRHGKHEEAQSYLRRALSIHRAGDDSHRVSQALYILAASLEEAGNLDGAAAEYEKLLVLRERQVGANPQETAEAQVRLAALQLRNGKVSIARELLLRALPTLERKGGPLFTRALETLADAEDRSGRVEQAKLYREQAIVAAALHVAETG